MESPVLDRPEELEEREATEKLVAFRNDVAKLVTLEKNNGETAHFAGNFSTKELWEEDRELYEKMLSNTLTKQEMEQHRKYIKDFGNESQSKFFAYVANQAQKKMLLSYAQGIN